MILKRQLGSSGIRIPEIGFGTWRYAGGVAPLRTAIEEGATFIDTAEIYGTEEIVGEAIRGRRKDIFLASKVRPANFRKDDLIKAAEGSLRRLGTDYLDLYQLHWPNYTVPIEETMSAMEQLVDAGKIRFIGLSNFSAEEIAAAQHCLRSQKIVSNQVRYSLIERTIEDGLLQYCRENQVTVIAYSPFGETFTVLREHDPEGALQSIAAKYKKTEAQVALNWLLADDSVVVIAKASSPEHVKDDCGASGWRLSDSDQRYLRKHIRFQRRSRAERFARRCARRVYQEFGRSL